MSAREPGEGEETGESISSHFFFCLAFALMPTSEGCNHHICKWPPPNGSVGSYPDLVGCVFPQISQDVAGGVARYVNRVEGVG